MTTPKMKTLLSAVMLGSLFLATGCGSNGGSPGNSTPSGAVQDTSGDTSAASPSEDATTSPASPSPTAVPGKTIVLNVTSQDGYEATITLTVSPPVQYEGENPPVPTADCEFTTVTGRGKYAYVVVTGELVPKAVNGISWPQDLALTVNAISQDSPCSGDPNIAPGTVFLKAGTVNQDWLRYEVAITPDNPNGWDATSPLPWSAIELQVDQGSGTYMCTVAQKDAGYEPIKDVLFNNGCHFTVGA